LSKLAGDRAVHARLMIVVAHPDDETLAIGAQLRRLGNTLLLHVTDGAPRDGWDARAHGFATLAEYAATRRRELGAALKVGEATALRTATLGVPDKDAFLDLAGLTRRLLQWLCREQPAAVLTHAYEGGHPDHDAAAFAVHAACCLISSEERPAIIEMPVSHADGGAMVTGRFLPGGPEGIVVPLDEAVSRRKRRMLECFRSQRETLACFTLGPERFRPAPAYDFCAPPHPGALLYETYGWGIRGDDWRRRAGDAFAALGLD
jgi:N-acetylglucosamine malate deacetylase 2